jgi:catechol 2,3-dioxygenase-like lactoylglutathione lyase family enzyme
MTALAEIAVFTDDVAAASAFYRGFLGDPVTEWSGGTLFAVGSGTLLVHERAAARSDGGPPNEDHFAMSVEDLDAVCASLAANGCTFLVEPRDYPWGRSAYLRDPDGRLVELAQA